MTDDRVETRVEADGPGEIGFQEYFVAHRHAVAVRSVRFSGADTAQPAPGVVEAIGSAQGVVIAPSNPVLSIGPVLALPAIDEAVAARREDTVAVSPIVAGAALRGPAARLLAELGHESSVVGVARLWAPWAATLVVDEADAGLADAVEEEGVRCVVAATVMRTPADAAALARTVLAAGHRS
jgi:LPPG:FO 2-phospho-L-lactate transferase